MLRPALACTRQAEFALALAVLLSFLAPSTHAQEQEARWFTFEISVFSNELAGDKTQEPPTRANAAKSEQEGAKRLAQLADLLAIPDLLFSEPVNSPGSAGSAASAISAPSQTSPGSPSLAVLPPEASGTGFRFVDLARDPFIALPKSESDFQQTNRALQRSPDYRLLHHEIWRQPLAADGQSERLAIEGGLARSVGGRRVYELQGTLDLHFNARRDRIVLDTELTLKAGEGKAYLHKQSRDMRSAEFHYLDSPALGVIFIAQPYTPPAIDALPPEAQQ